jgi:hypothetical protein
VHVYEVHVIRPEPGRVGTRHTDIREAVKEYLNHPDTKLRINIEGLVITLDEVMIASFHGFEINEEEQRA